MRGRLSPGFSGNLIENECFIKRAALIDFSLKKVSAYVTRMRINPLVRFF